ncbi:hypothetical protein E8E13_002152 [Curvularia kusanoi]|uniref:Trichothecene 3-O-acetyltransferase n=1 Tax=Curvularia kusanoi TaxID=90978 RepID=A0A9P4TD64_CURKU|nr:hypothetical protein E8E13_002152 [Curvularia kusanoi]
MSTTEMQVHPIGWENGPVEEQFAISDVDHTMPNIYVQIVEVFKLEPTSEKPKIVESMVKGLEYTLSQFPILAGALKMDPKNGQLWATKKRDSTVGLSVQDIEESFSSYEELEKSDFPVASLKWHKLMPKAVTEKVFYSPPEDDQEDCPAISTFQINFIKGGLILGVAVHHNCSDGPGCDRFLTMWAKNSAAVSKGLPFHTVPGGSSDRSRLSAKKPDAVRWKQIDQKIPVLRYGGGPALLPPADFKMPEITLGTWHFPKSKMEELKTKATSRTGVDWISTYDAITSILWKTITRSKLKFLQPDLNKEVVLVHAVNMRKAFDPPLPETYIGNAVGLARTEPMKISDLIADDNLPELAQRVRNSIKTITPQYAAELPEWVAGLEDRRWININVDAFLGMDMTATSWQAMNAYQQHDFGFGIVRAVRSPDPPYEGYVFVYPSRADVKENAVDEGIEVCVCLEKSCHVRLAQDEELLEYAQPRGN